MARHHMLSTVIHCGARRTLAGVLQPPLVQTLSLLLFTDYLNSLSSLEFIGRTQRANDKHFFIRIWNQRVFSVFTKHLGLFALEVFVCFKLPWKAAPSYLVYASQHWSPAIGLSRRRSRWLWCVSSNHIPSSLPLFKQLVSCTVAL